MPSPATPTVPVAPEPGKRSTREEVTARVEAVADLVINHRAGMEEIKAYALKNNWNVCGQTLWNYRREALSKIQSRQSQNDNLLYSLTTRRALVEDAIAQGDLRTAGVLLREFDKILGHYPRTGDRNTPEVTATDSSLSLEQLQQEEFRIRDDQRSWSPPTLRLAEPPEEPPAPPAQAKEGG